MRQHVVEEVRDAAPPTPRQRRARDKDGSGWETPPVGLKTRINDHYGLKPLSCPNPFDESVSEGKGRNTHAHGQVCREEKPLKGILKGSKSAESKEDGSAWAVQDWAVGSLVAKLPQTHARHFL